MSRFAEWLKSIPGVIDLILLDLAFPRGLSGYDIYDDIQAIQELKAIPIVVVTAADLSVEMPKARQKGLNGFISKPLSYVLGSRMLNIKRRNTNFPNTTNDEIYTRKNSCHWFYSVHSC
jgi:DNA-binding response OmpR family regulator